MASVRVTVSLTFTGMATLVSLQPQGIHYMDEGICTVLLLCALCTHTPRKKACLHHLHNQSILKYLLGPGTHDAGDPQRSLVSGQLLLKFCQICKIVPTFGSKLNLKPEVLICSCSSLTLSCKAALTISQKAREPVIYLLSAVRWLQEEMASLDLAICMMLPL